MTDSAEPSVEERDESERWSSAAVEVRAAAKWLATAVGAVGAVVFGGGPLLRTDVDPSSWGVARWLLVLGAAVVGVLCTALIVGRLLRSILPVELTLRTLPLALRKEIEKDPADYLPDDVTTLSEFRDRMRSHAVIARTLRRDAELEKDPSEKTRLEQAAQIQADNCDIFLRARTELFARAKYLVESERVAGGWRGFSWLVVPAIGSVVAATVFTLLTHNPEDETPAPAPKLAVLLPGAGSEILWRDLDLARCQPDADELGIPVLLVSTSGEDVKNYSVQTLGTPQGCGSYSFTVSDENFDVVVPKPTKIEGAN